MQLLFVQLIFVLVAWFEGCHGGTQEDDPGTGQGPIDVLKNQDIGLSIGVMSALIVFLIGLTIFVYRPTRKSPRQDPHPVNRNATI